MEDGLQGEKRWVYKQCMPSVYSDGGYREELTSLKVFRK